MKFRRKKPARHTKKSKDFTRWAVPKKILAAKKEGKHETKYNT